MSHRPITLGRLSLTFSLLSIHLFFFFKSYLWFRRHMSLVPISLILNPYIFLSVFRILSLLSLYCFSPSLSLRLPTSPFSFPLPLPPSEAAICHTYGDCNKTEEWFVIISSSVCSPFFFILLASIFFEILIPCYNILFSWLLSCFFSDFFKIILTLPLYRSVYSIFIPFFMPFLHLLFSFPLQRTPLPSFPRSTSASCNCTVQESLPCTDVNSDVYITFRRLVPPVPLSPSRCVR